MYKFIVKIRSGILVFLTHNMALPMLKLFRKSEVFPYSIERLKRFPAGTLGNDLAVFLDVNNLQLLPYYARHDIKHILLGYETTDEGEGSLQCFMLGNRHVSFPVLATVVYCFLTMPEHWHSFRSAFRRGRKATRISGWNWFEILHQRTISLKLKIDQPR
jgi:ubiquinone biosynthesis protein Coq4